jgi:exosortase E/protease (VPEID-CTERM system)
MPEHANVDRTRPGPAMSETTPSLAAGARGVLVALVAGVIALELIGLAYAFQFLTSFDCAASGNLVACQGVRNLVVRALSIFAVLGVYAWARPGAFGFLARSGLWEPRAARWILLHAAGVALMFAPLPVLLTQGVAEVRLNTLLGPWLAGAAMASAGALLWLAPWAAWRAFAARERFLPLALVALGFALPSLARLLQPLWWHWDGLTRATFAAVTQVLTATGAPVTADPESYLLGSGDFLVEIAKACAGIEGFALVAAFLGLYAGLFRAETRFPRFWILLPVGLALSWGLNVVRIAALIWIGAHVSPALAVDGFHSFAGWMFFTFLALGLLWAAHALPWFQAEPAARVAAPPLRSDRTAARLQPVVAIMLASVVTSALFPHPELGYPLKAAAMAAALGVFVGHYRHLARMPDPLALVAGLAVGVLWLMLRPADAAADTALDAALAGLAPVAFAAWVVIRVAGTVLLVPLVEELFFRGYLLARLDRGGAPRRLLALAVSSGLFATLHGSWLAAGLAGLIFGLVMLHRGRLTDAIAAHVAANLVVALWALSRGDWGAI